jgi:hypothetical protein
MAICTVSKAYWLAQTQQVHNRNFFVEAYMLSHFHGQALSATCIRATPQRGRNKWAFYGRAENQLRLYVVVGHMPTNPGILAHPLHRVTPRVDVMVSWAVVLPRDLDNSFGCDTVIAGLHKNKKRFKHNNTNDKREKRQTFIVTCCVSSTRQFLHLNGIFWSSVAALWTGNLYFGRYRISPTAFASSFPSVHEERVHLALAFPMLKRGSRCDCAQILTLHGIKKK